MRKRGFRWRLGCTRTTPKHCNSTLAQHELIVADDAMTGAFDEHVWKGQADDTMVRALQHWIAVVASGGA